MLNFGEILETVNMVREEHFDVRTITLGLNLLGSVRETAEKPQTPCTITFAGPQAAS